MPPLDQRWCDGCGAGRDGQHVRLRTSHMWPSRLLCPMCGKIAAQAYLVEREQRVFTARLAVARAMAELRSGRKIRA
jgi:hypothetical protein